MHVISLREPIGAISSMPLDLTTTYSGFWIMQGTCACHLMPAPRVVVAGNYYDHFADTFGAEGLHAKPELIQLVSN